MGLASVRPDPSALSLPAVAFPSCCLVLVHGPRAHWALTSLCSPLGHRFQLLLGSGHHKILVLS